MVGCFREGKVQLPLADERLLNLIPQGVWLPLDELRQAPQGDESPFAKLQQDSDENRAIHLALGSGLRGHRSQPKAQRRGEHLQIDDHG